MTSDFADALASGRPLVLDGGLSNQLELTLGHDLSDGLWSARLLAEEPGAIAEAHLAYFEAGADVAITSSYQATFEGFARRGIGLERAAELLALSVELARDAARRAGAARPLWVAASAGLYGAMLADGSEYRAGTGSAPVNWSASTGRASRVLAAARPDVLALETVPDTDEAAALRAGGARTGRTGLAVVHRRGRPDPRRSAAGGRLRPGGGGGGG
ncbi:homocysteine S-methyltransferase family protein [Streptomyces thinghirensis]|nr:homocysteine S-methyltransferase family protein [Streptomyces thinghirensis]